MDKDFEKDILKKDPDDDFSEWAEFFNEPNDNYPDFDDNELIDRFDCEMGETLEKADERYEEKRASGTLETEEKKQYYQEPEKKIYEYPDFVFNEEAGYVMVRKYGEPSKFYRVITEEENEQKKLFHFGNALHFVAAVLLSLTAIPAAQYYQDVYEKSGFKSLLVDIGLAAPFAIVTYFFVACATFGLAYVLNLEKYIKEDKRLKPAIMVYIAWALIAIAIIVIMPSNEPF